MTFTHEFREYVAELVKNLSGVDVVSTSNSCLGGGDNAEQVWDGWYQRRLTRHFR